MTSAPTTGMLGKPKLWVPGDWNAFFGFGTNILVNLLTLSGLLRFVLQMPDELVFKRILPAAGLMMCMSTIYYASLAYRLAKKTGRTDVCALPSGISVPHMFIVTLVIMLPVKLATGDPMKGWQAGLTWVFIQSFVLMAGGYLAPIIRRITPKAALLGALAGVSITFISMKPALEMFMTPMVGVVCFAIILVSWFGGVKFGGIPAGLVAIAAGTLIAWGSNLFGLHFGGMSAEALKGSFQTFGFAVPHPVIGLVLGGLHWSFLKTILVTAIPFGIYDLVEAMDNVVSASAAGDEYPTTRVLTADGVVSLIGCLMGNPYINAVYIGHPGWKAMGGRIGYSAATGVMVIILSWFGVISLMTALDPGRRHLADPALHRHADRLAGVPGEPAPPRTGHRRRARSLARRLGQAADRQLPGRHLRHPPGHPRHDRLDEAGRHHVPRPVDPRRWVDPRGRHPRGHDHVHHRPPLLQGGGLRGRRRRPDLLRPHARRRGRRVREPRPSSSPTSPSPASSSPAAASPRSPPSRRPRSTKWSTGSTRWRWSRFRHDRRRRIGFRDFLNRR